MIRKYCITFYCQATQADHIRELLRQYFRQHNLLCRTQRTYPEQGWNTPAIGSQIEVWAIVSPKEPQSQNKGLHRICQDSIRMIRDRFGLVADPTIETLWC